jgi:hypothetical protein
MCGICGLRRMGDQPLSRAMFEILLVENQRRGNHATGAVIQQADGSIEILKRDVPAWNFINSDEYQKWIKLHLKPDTRTIMGHTRQATQGPPHINKNNHPLFDGVSAVIHNGMIGNDDGVFKSLNLERKCATDSDIIRAILDEYGLSPKGISQLSKLSGSGAIAAVSTDYPHLLFLGRSGNPIETASIDDVFLWSSEIQPIIKASRPFVKKFGMYFRKHKSDLSTAAMHDNSAWIMDYKAGKDGSFIKWHQQLNIASSFTPHCYDVNRTYFGMRMRFYDDRPVNVAKCPNKKCDRWVELTPIMLKAVANNIGHIKCKVCDTPLKAIAKPNPVL